jgi:hypothetical protein
MRKSGKIEEDAEASKFAPTLVLVKDEKIQ